MNSARRRRIETTYSSTITRRGLIALTITTALCCCKAANAFCGVPLPRGIETTTVRSAVQLKSVGTRKLTKRFAASNSEDSQRNENTRDSTTATTSRVDDGSWSRTANGMQRDRVGVRSRVKSVLAKAKNRTKVAIAGAASTIADAASIGGFEEDLTSDYAGISVQEKVKVNGVKNPTTPKVNGSHGPSNYTDVVDAFGGDISAAFSIPADPLPFERPALTQEQEQLLRRGERIQYQRDMGREGYGYVVVDVNAPPDVVWDCLLDFHSYPELIPTVRDIRMYTNTHLERDYRAEKPLDYEDGTVATLKHGVPSVTRAAFTLSKFRLTIAAIHKYAPHPAGDYMIFTLDPACTNFVLKFAKGVWHTQEDPYGDGSGVTRVWLLCELGVSKLLPMWITDYAAKRAMPRATTWLKPQVEAAAKLWLKKPPSANGEQ